MNKDELTAVRALREILELTDMCDWHLVNATVREDVAAGRFSNEFEDAYRKMVDSKAKVRLH